MAHRLGHTVTSRLLGLVAGGSLGVAATLGAQESALEEDDWPAFRGMGATGRAAEAPPVEWSQDDGVVWKVELPGPGASSPVVVGERVYVTCWSGYGLSRSDPGDPAALQRHVLAFDRSDGSLLWRDDIDRAENEDRYQGRIEHGYATSTPACDGQRLFVFMGKRGVLAYSLDGTRLWERSVGQGSSDLNTGSAPSPTLCGDHVIILASDEGPALWGLDAASGEVAWTREAPELHLSFTTPTATPDGSLVIVPMLRHIWAIDPATGETVWSVRTKTSGDLAPSVIVGDDVVFSMGGQSRERLYAVRLGGQGDVTDTHVEWVGRFGAYVPSPVLVDDHLFFVDDQGMATCLDASNGKSVFRERLDAPFYASVVEADGLLYCVSRDAGTFVLAAAPEFERMAHNVLEGDDSSFDASPAISVGQMFLRSGTHLYCIE